MSTLHRIFRRMFQNNLSFDVKEGVMTCVRCKASCKMHDGLKCAIPSPLILISVNDSESLSFYTGSCLFDGLTYSEAKDVLSERS